VPRTHPHILALDLEGTLISNAMSCFPRPGLYEFVEGCQQIFERIVLFTAVSGSRVHPILELLASDGSAPAWFRDVEVVSWTGNVKDLHFIGRCTPNEVLLVDDMEGYVHPNQREQWVAIASFAPPYPPTDRELARVMEELRRRTSPRMTNV
jgi:NLI interacting factor-like phosphatase